MARLDIRTSDELVQQLLAAKPKSLSLSRFCAFLIESQLTGGSNVRAYCVGAGTQEQSGFPATTMQALQPAPQGSASEASAVATAAVEAVDSHESAQNIEPKGEGCRGGGQDFQLLTLLPDPTASSATAVGATGGAKAKKPKTETDPAFEAFWKQYLAIQHRANGQAKPAALTEWKQATKEITPEQLQRALTAALVEQTRVVKETGWAAPFPACHRWLAKGYWQQFSEKEPLCPVPVITEIRDPNHPDF